MNLNFKEICTNIDQEVNKLQKFNKLLANREIPEKKEECMSHYSCDTCPYFNEKEIWCNWISTK